MNDPMRKINIDQILDGSTLANTPELRALLEEAYDVGALEAAVAPSAPGDPAAAEREATTFAVAAKLVLSRPAIGLAVLQSVLDAHLARKTTERAPS